MSIKNAPAPGDYKGATEAQADASKANVQAQTVANRPNQQNSFGGSQWTQGPDGQWTQNSTLAPGLQGTANSLQQQAQANASKPMDDGSAARDQAITGAYNQAKSRLDPQWAQKNEQMQSQLSNQGLDPNSAAYRNAMLQNSQAQNDAYGGAMSNAIAQGTAAQQATFGENMQAQMAPYQQLQALRGLGQQYGFNAAGQAQAPNYLGAQLAQDQAGLERYNLDNQNNADLYGAGFGLLNTFVPFGKL